MELIDRFRYIMKLHNLSASAFADKIGVQRSSVSHVLSGRNKPSLEFIQKVLKAYPKIDANWLINGTTKVGLSKSTGELNFEEEQEAEIPENTVKTEGKDERERKKDDNLFDSTKSEKQIERIVIFYNDQTFETFKK